MFVCFTLMLKLRPSSGLINQPADTWEHSETCRWSQLMTHQKREDSEVIGGKLAGCRREVNQSASQMSYRDDKPLKAPL